MIEIEAVESPDMVIEFINEANEHLDVIEEKILELEDNNKDKVLINDIFRPFHSMKGIAGFTGLPIVSSFAHDTETILDLARNDKLVINPDIIQLLLKSVDIIKEMVQRIVQKIENPKETVYYPDFDEHSETLSDIALNPPTEDVSPSAQKPASSGSAATSIDETVAKATAPATPHPTATKVQEEIRVRLDKVNNLINLVGELVISQTMLSENKQLKELNDKLLNKEMSYIEKITKDIQNISMSLRMVSLHPIYQKMTRLVRDVSKALNKEINFVTMGEDTEVDRSVIELLNDPLVHILRNSVDHGVELPVDREKAGKKREGTVTLKAAHQGENIIIEIIDDGKGMNKDKLIEAAIKKGIIHSEEEMKGKNPFELIFAAGFSTAAQVTNVSGRGVGMDVVRRNIDSLHGKIDVQSVEGEGTTISIRLPLTMAIIDGMVVRVGTERFIIPTLSIVESFQPSKEDIYTLEGEGEMVKLRDEVYSINRLNRMFEINNDSPSPTETLLMVVESNGQNCCILVDELMGKQQVVIKPLGESMKKIDGILGAAILADGSIGLILNAEEIIDLCSGVS